MATRTVFGEDVVQLVDCTRTFSGIRIYRDWKSCFQHWHETGYYPVGTLYLLSLLLKFTSLMYILTHPPIHRISHHYTHEVAYFRAVDCQDLRLASAAPRQARRAFTPLSSGGYITCFSPHPHLSLWNNSVTFRDFFSSYGVLLSSVWAYSSPGSLSPASADSGDL